MNPTALTIMRYQDDINTQHEFNMPRGSGSVDKAPDSQWIYVVRVFKTGKAQIFFYYISFDVVVKIEPFGTRTRNFHSQVRRFAGLSIPGLDIDLMSCSAEVFNFFGKCH